MQTIQSAQMCANGNLTSSGNKVDQFCWQYHQCPTVEVQSWGMIARLDVVLVEISRVVQILEMLLQNMVEIHFDQR